MEIWVDKQFGATWLMKTGLIYNIQLLINPAD